MSERLQAVCSRAPWGARICRLAHRRARSAGSTKSHECDRSWDSAADWRSHLGAFVCLITSTTRGGLGISLARLQERRVSRVPAVHGFACSRAEHRAEHRDASAGAAACVRRVHSEERISIRGLLDSRSPRPALPLGSCGSSFGPHRAFELDGNVWSRTSRNRLVSVTPNLATGTRS